MHSIARLEGFAMLNRGLKDGFDEAKPFINNK